MFKVTALDLSQMCVVTCFSLQWTHFEERDTIRSAVRVEIISVQTRIKFN